MGIPGGNKPPEAPTPHSQHQPKSDLFELHGSPSQCSLNSNNLIPFGFSNFRQLCKAQEPNK